MSLVDAKHHTSEGDWRSEITSPESRPAGENRQSMDSIFKTARPINAEPIRHPNVPGCSVRVGNFVQHAEFANARGIAHARGRDKTINDLPIIVRV